MTVLNSDDVQASIYLRQYTKYRTQRLPHMLYNNSFEKKETYGTKVSEHKPNVAQPDKKHTFQNESKNYTNLWVNNQTKKMFWTIPPHLMSK